MDPRKLVKFNPELPESLKAGDVFEFTIRCDSGIRLVRVTQDHPSHPIDEFDGNGTKEIKIKFAICLGTTSITLEIFADKKLSVKVPTHWNN